MKPEPKEQIDDNVGIIEVESYPTNAKVSITFTESEPLNNLGVTPFEGKLRPGTYWVTLSKEGYEDAVAKVVIPSGETTVIVIDLESKNPATEAKRIAGHAMLWPGLGSAVAGIALIEIDPQGSIGTAGFITVGAGIALTITGGVLLGLAHRDRVIYEKPHVAAIPLPDGSGGAILFSKSF